MVVKDYFLKIKAIIFVSNDINAGKVLCDSAILLHHGQIIDRGIPKDVVDFYQNMVMQKNMKKINKLHSRFK